MSISLHHEEPLFKTSIAKIIEEINFCHHFTCLSCFIRASALFPTSSFLFFFRALGPRSPVALLVRFGFCTGALFVMDCKSFKG